MGGNRGSLNHSLTPPEREASLTEGLRTPKRSACIRPKYQTVCVVCDVSEVQTSVTETSQQKVTSSNSAGRTVFAANFPPVTSPTNSSLS